MVHGNGSVETYQSGRFSVDAVVQLQEVIEACDVGLCLLDVRKRVVALNRRLADSIGATDQEVLERPIEDLIPQLAGPRFSKMVQAAVQQSEPEGVLKTFYPGLGSSRHLFSADGKFFMRVSVKPLMMHPGYCLVQISELDSTVAIQEQLRGIGLTEQRSRAMLSSVEDAVILLDADARIEFANLAAEGMTGYQNRQITGRCLTDIYRVYDESDAEGEPLPIERILHGENQQLVLMHREGLSIPIQQTITRIKDDQGDLECMVVVFKDTSQSRKLAAQLSWQSSHDPTTRLYNRAEFDRQLSRLLEEANYEGGQHCLLYLDIDRFKVVNDNCGHAAGDELLRQIGSLIRRAIRSSDLLARLGGDEFGILLSQCTLDAAERIADTIRLKVQGYRFAWGDKTFSQSISIGMVRIDKQSEGIEQILSFADTACFSAKEEGRNKIHVYHPVKSSAAKRHGEAQWVTRIRSALEEDRFTLFVQPIRPISGNNGAREHVEVLIRMLDESGGMILPGAFIPAAERYDLMPGVDQWVIDRLIRYLTEHRDRCLASGRRFFVNLSGQSLCDEEVLQSILDKIGRQKIPKGMLCFEVTETAAITNLTSAEHFMRTLQRYGCEFALDDFGSGLSSFGYLKHLPVEYLKIDGVFVKEMVESAIDESMVDAINRIGHIMGLETIAEFVENRDILHRLQALGVDYAQGYGIRRPFPIDELFS